MMLERERESGKKCCTFMHTPTRPTNPASAQGVYTEQSFWPKPASYHPRDATSTHYILKTIILFSFEQKPTKQQR